MITTYQPNYSEVNNNNNNATRLMQTMLVANSESNPSAIMAASLFNLQQRMQIYAIEKRPTPLSNEILHVALSALNFYQAEEGADKLFDLYLTINTVFNIVRNTTSEEKLQNEIAAFLSVREDLLRDDCHDYCFTTSLANEFCYHLVKTVFPALKSPANRLLHNAITQNKGKPSLWQHPIEMDEDLPAAFSDFFRTADNHIQLYESILSRAIAQLKRGHAVLSWVWLNTDPRFPSTEPLTRADLAILKYRSPTFKTLVTYTEQLAEQNSGLYDKFVKLENGLANSGTSSASDPKPMAYLAIQEFSNWWNDLNTTEDGQKLRTKIESISDGNLGRFINGTLLTQHDYCAPGTGGGTLGLLLSKDGVAEEFRKIENDAEMASVISVLNAKINAKDRVSHAQLDQWETTIINELKNTRPTIPVVKNAFIQAFRYLAIFSLDCDLNLDHLKLLTDDKKTEFLKAVCSQNHPGLDDALGKLLIDYMESGDNGLAQLILTHRPQVSQEVSHFAGNHAIHIAYITENLEITKLLCKNPRAFQVTNSQNENIFDLVTKSVQGDTRHIKKLNGIFMFFVKSYPMGFNPDQMRIINKFSHHHNLNIVLPYGEVPDASKKQYYKQYKQSMFYQHSGHGGHQHREKLKSKLQNAFHHGRGPGR